MRQGMKTLVGVAVIAAATFVVYSPVVTGDFVWDDDTHVTANLLTQPHGLYRSWFTTDQANYWPVTWTAFWIQWKLWRADPVGYHVVTILLHIGVALMLWRVLRQLGIPGAWLAALIFAVHPVNVESGAWITQQKNLLAALFGAASVSLYLRSDEGPRFGAFYVLALAAFLAGLLAKTSIVVLPAAMLGCVWWRRGVLTRKDAFRAAPFFALSIVLSLNEVWFQYNRASADWVRTDSLLSRFAVAGHAVLFYLGKIVRPHDLCFVYANPACDLRAVTTYLPHALLLAVAVASLWKRDSWGRPILFGMGYYVATLLPVLGFLNIYFMRYSLLSDHWQYVSAIGPIALGVGVLTAGLRRASGALRNVAYGAAAVYVLLLGALAYERAKVFRDSEALWEDTLEKNPTSWMACNNYGSLLLSRNRPAEAIGLLRYAVHLHGGSLKARMNLAAALARAGRPDEAAAALAEAERLAPGRPDLLVERGRLEFARKNLAQARACFEAVAPTAGVWADAQVCWAAVERSEGRADAAAERLLTVLRTHPRRADANQMLGDILFGQEKWEAALARYRAAAEMDPAYPNVYNDIGVACTRTGDWDGAERAFREAVRKNPKDPKAAKNLRMVLGGR